MGQLRDRMEQDLKLRGLSPATIRNYLLYGRKFAAFFMRSPEQLGAAEVRAFLLHQIEVEQLAYASYRQVYAALKFLYSVTLGRPGEVGRLPFPKRRPSGLPKVLTADELTAFFAALRKAKYRALFMTCYAAGLRLGDPVESQPGPTRKQARSPVRRLRRFCRYVDRDQPECFVLTPAQVKQLVHRGVKGDKVSFWLQPKHYESDLFRDRWELIGSGLLIAGVHLDAVPPQLPLPDSRKT
jgi:hypothetical protein